MRSLTNSRRCAGTAAIAGSTIVITSRVTSSPKRSPVSLTSSPVRCLRRGCAGTITVAGQVVIVDADTSFDDSIPGASLAGIAVGDRIAQLLLVPVARARLVQVSAFAPSARGAGGFGSTGVR